MTIQKQETFKEFIINNDLLKDSKKNLNKNLSKEVIVELIIIFLKINKEDILKITNDELLYQTILTDDYYINGDFICNDNEAYSLDYLIEIVKIIYNNKTTNKKNNVIDIDFVRIASNPKKKKSDIEETIVSPIPILTKGERKYILERMLEVNSDTKDYVEGMKYEFESNLNYMIYNIVVNHNFDFTPDALNFLFTIVKLYPVVMYNEEEFDYQLLNINPNEISMVKATFCNDIIKFKEKKIDEYEHKKEILIIRKEYISRYLRSNINKLSVIDQEIDRINQKEFMLGIDLYEDKIEESNYNDQILLIIREAFNQHTIDFIMYEDDPIITMLNITNNKVDNMIEMHLSTLSKIIDKNKIISRLNQKALKKVDNN